VAHSVNNERTPTRSAGLPNGTNGRVSEGGDDHIDSTSGSASASSSSASCCIRHRTQERAQAHVEVAAGERGRKPEDRDQRSGRGTLALQGRQPCSHQHACRGARSH
jgi:hypothetical protein